jgi:hypothetical protein
MITIVSDLVRTACVVAAMAVAASLVVEVRFSLAAIEVASRQAQQPPMYARTPEQPVGRLRAVGRAAIDFADAALGVAR